jgi:hypothetical protein
MSDENMQAAKKQWSEKVNTASLACESLEQRHDSVCACMHSPSHDRVNVWFPQMEERPFSSLLGGKPAEMRQITPSEGIQATTNAYVKADAAVTQAILGLHSHPYIPASKRITRDKSFMLQTSGR